MHSVSRPFFDRDVGSSILASLSEAGGNDLRQPTSKPLPPHSPVSVDRHLECTLCTPEHARGQPVEKIAGRQFIGAVQVGGVPPPPQPLRWERTTDSGDWHPASGRRKGIRPRCQLVVLLAPNRSLTRKLKCLRSLGGHVSGRHRPVPLTGLKSSRRFARNKRTPELVFSLAAIPLS